MTRLRRRASSLGRDALRGRPVPPPITPPPPATVMASPAGQNLDRSGHRRRDRSARPGIRPASRLPLGRGLDGCGRWRHGLRERLPAAVAPGRSASPEHRTAKTPRTCPRCTIRPSTTSRSGRASSRAWRGRPWGGPERRRALRRAALADRPGAFDQGALPDRPRRARERAASVPARASPRRPGAVRESGRVASEPRPGVAGGRRRGRRPRAGPLCSHRAGIDPRLAVCPRARSPAHGARPGEGEHELVWFDPWTGERVPESHRRGSA